jgi:hypothetical protein
MFEASELPTQMPIASINILYDFYIILMFYTTKNIKSLFQNIISFTVNTKTYLTKAITGQTESSNKESCSLVCAVTYVCMPLMHCGNECVSCGGIYLVLKECPSKLVKIMDFVLWEW